MNKKITCLTPYGESLISKLYETFNRKKVCKTFQTEFYKRYVKGKWVNR